MPSASITVSEVAREKGEFTVVDTSDYTGVTVTSTDLQIIDPNNVTYNVDIYSENFGTLNGTYTITTALLSYPQTEFPDGVYSLTFTANLDAGGPLVSPVTNFLFSVNSKVCWADRFENCLDGDNCFTDEEKENRTDVRELIQAAETHFSQSRFSSASSALETASSLCDNKCNC